MGLGTLPVQCQGPAKKYVIFDLLIESADLVVLLETLGTRLGCRTLALHILINAPVKKLPLYWG